MNLYKQKDKISALSMRMVTWANRTKIPTSNSTNHIPEVDRDGNIAKYPKRDGYYVVNNVETNLRKWSDDFKWVTKKDFYINQMIDVQEMTDKKFNSGAIEVHGLSKKEMKKANMLFDIYNPDQILMR